MAIVDFRGFNRKDGANEDSSRFSRAWIGVCILWGGLGAVFCAGACNDTSNGADPGTRYKSEIGSRTDANIRSRRIFSAAGVRADRRNVRDGDVAEPGSYCG
ncbi:MAG: hypothetical protein WB787_03990, partial [Candidatus Acidiferrales bacterium]